MKYRRLGRSGLRVSVVGFGTWQFGGEWGQPFTQPEVDQLLGRAKDWGINLIDTAECYGDHRSEALLGHSIRHERQDWVVATKFGHKFAGHLLREQLLVGGGGTAAVGGFVAGAAYRLYRPVPVSFRHGCGL
jgi:aryl-alcohol dehydrogenase-like predicted oxidoreductase